MRAAGVVTALIVGATVVDRAAAQSAPQPTATPADTAVLARVPRTASGGGGRPADPVNLLVYARVGDLAPAFTAAGWRAARALGLRADARLAEAVLLDRADSTAPVSTLRLFGRAQDLAFEREDALGARRRDHVRLWRLAGPARPDGAAAWAGAATFDDRIGVHDARPIHHVARHVDMERDTVRATLARAGWVRAERAVAGRVPRAGVDGATGDPWLSDGTLVVLDLAPPSVRPPVRPPGGPPVSRPAARTP